MEEANSRKMNQGVFNGYRQKAIVARCAYKDDVLLFVQYDDARDKGTVEVYQRVQNDWKRTTALADDETVAVLLSAFRTGELVEQQIKNVPP